MTEVFERRPAVELHPPGGPITPNAPPPPNTRARKPSHRLKPFVYPPSPRSTPSSARGSDASAGTSITFVAAEGPQSASAERRSHATANEACAPPKVPAMATVEVQLTDPFVE